MDANALMRLLVPDGKVNEVAEALHVSPSLVYQERKPKGEGYGQNGTRNSIGRLDIIAEMALDWSPETVRMLGQRYLDIYANAVVCHTHPDDETDLRRVLAQTSIEVGEAMSALIEGDDADRCAVEVEQAILWLQRAQRLVEKRKGGRRR
jgi:hypothetical protein